MGAAGQVRTNTIEGVWSPFKRSIMGSFHKISAKHMDRSLEELEWRFNNRDSPHIFRDTLARVVNTDPLRYRELMAWLGAPNWKPETIWTVIVIVTAGCDSALTEPSPPPPAEWQVSGTVRDSRMSSLRIAGARVAVTLSGHSEEYSAETDAEGRYRIRVPEGSAVLAIDGGPTYVRWRANLSVATDTVLPDAAMRHTGQPPWLYTFSAAGDADSVRSECA